MKKSFSCLVTLILFFGLFHQLASAEQAYVADTCLINLRTGPTTEYRIIASLSSGTPVEILEETTNWSHIRYTNGDKTREGWVPKRFLAVEPPWQEQAREMNASLHEQVKRIEEERNAFSQQEAELKEKLQSAVENLKGLQQAYDEIKAGAANYLELKEQYDSANSDLAAARTELEELNREVENLRLSQRLQWFVAGAMVLLGGWLIGLTMGRYQKKRRSSFHI